MNTVNQTFDWNRFTAALRKELVESKRGILITLLSVYGLLTMVMIIGNVIFGSERVGFPYAVVFVIFTFTVCIAAGLAFRKLTKKNGRVDLFTSPSSTLEKFLVNALIYVLGFIVAFFVCAQLADLTRIAALWYFHNRMNVPGPINFLNILSSPFSFGDEELIGSSTLTITLPLSVIASGGLFLMGSVLWPRLSVLKTFAALYGVEIVVVVLGIVFSAIVGDSVVTEYVKKFVSVFSGSDISYWTIGWYVIQILLFWGLAWYLFKRKDVVSLKWWK